MWPLRARMLTQHSSQVDKRDNTPSMVVITAITLKNSQMWAKTCAGVYSVGWA